jgi:hypothetical protein
MEDVGIFNSHLAYLEAIWHILRLFWHILYIFSDLVSCSKKNLATLPWWRGLVLSSPPATEEAGAMGS